jgi:hypothetical protein
MGAGGGITNRVAVRRRTSQIYGCERSADGGSIFDHELLTQPLRKVMHNDSGDRIAGAAWRCGQDEADDALGPFIVVCAALRPRASRKQR